jgi:hypothetical protein
MANNQENPLVPPVELKQCATEKPIGSKKIADQVGDNREQIKRTIDLSEYGIKADSKLTEVLIFFELRNSKS